MTEFEKCSGALTRVAPLDPAKHVNYSLGMVLGVDDFDQEFVYSANRDRWMTRDLAGYGTVSGLRVQVDDEGAGPRISVSAGTAVTPAGQLVRVPRAQCATLDNWLVANDKAVAAQLEDSDELTLHLVLRYAECLTDAVPVPGEPCRTEDRLTAASRVMDDFRLELRLKEPNHHEEHGLRDLVAWLRKIPLAGDGETPTKLAALLDAMRAEAQPALDALADLEHPPTPPLDLLKTDPPANLRLGGADLPETLRAAFRLWVTELRPALAPDATDDAVLLATLTGKVDNGESGSGWTDPPDESRRPYLLHTRLLQEWLLTTPAPTTGVPEAGGPAPVTPAGNPVKSVKAQTIEPGTEKQPEWKPDTGALTLFVPKGKDGVKGADGRSVTEVKVTTLPPGTQATRDYKPETGVLTLNIPRGDKGEPGTTTAAPSAPRAPVVVAAGHWVKRNEGSAEMARDWSFPKENVKLENCRGSAGEDAGLWHLTFPGFSPTGRYVVKGIVETDYDAAAQTPEQIRDIADLRQTTTFTGVQLPPVGTGIFLRTDCADSEVVRRGLFLEVTDYAGVTA